MKKLLLFLALLSMVGLLATTIVKKVEFSQNCSGYLKQAADANSITLAKERLQKSVDYLESNNLTEGYTSLFYKTEDDNIGYWYLNLKTSLNDLNKINTDSISSLEESNVLLKLRETILDNNDSGDSVTIPNGISRYPNNLLFFMWAVLSFLIVIITTPKTILKIIIEL